MSSNWKMKATMKDQISSPACEIPSWTMAPRTAPRIRSSTIDAIKGSRYHRQKADGEDRPLKFVRLVAADLIDSMKLTACRC